MDVRVFETERAAAAKAMAAGDAAAFLTHAEAAIAEYRGELIPGSYDDWVLDEREPLLRGCVDLCDGAIAARREAGDRSAAIAIARRRVELKPLEEVGYRVLMELQAQAGDRAAAVSTYHRCATVLERELGVSPDTETTALVDRLLERRDTPATSLDLAGYQSGRTGAGGRGLVGRDREMELLEQCWRRAADGRAALVLVSGEPGVGKSRLVAELGLLAGAEGAVVATARCFGQLGRLALAPVADWLRSPDLAGAVAALEPVWQLEIERLVPRPGALAGRAEAGTGRPPADGTLSMGDGWQRHRFFEGLARAVIPSGRPALLVLDDVQWCDQETVAWLVFVLGFAAGTPLLVAATARSNELDDNREVSASLRALRSAGMLTDIDLAPLDPTGTGELAASILGRPLGPPEEILLHSATGGYPLFVAEAARSLPDPTTLGPSLLITDLDAVLRRRLEQASPVARQVAGLASAVGRDFSLDLLSEASDLDTDSLVRAVDELWRLRILREQRSGYDFSHDLLRDAAYASITPPRRWLLHRRLAQGIELLHSDDDDSVAALLGEQYDRGGRPDRAFIHFRRAADAAAAVFANADALRHHRRCLGLVEAMPAGRDRDERELEVLQAMCAPLNGLQGYSSPALRVDAGARRRPWPRAWASREVLIRNLVGLFGVHFVQGHIAPGPRAGRAGPGPGSVRPRPGRPGPLRLRRLGVKPRPAGHRDLAFRPGRRPVAGRRVARRRDPPGGPRPGVGRPRLLAAR